MKALVIEDDPIYAKKISTTLEQHGIHCDICHKAEDGLFMLEACDYDIAILDTLLPDSNGNAVIQQVRASNQIAKKNIPIIVLSNLQSSDNKVEAFINGADDFVSKPYETKEFIMRILTAIRRHNGHSDNKIKIGDISLDLKERSVSFKGKKLKLSSKEFQLFQLLAMKKDNTLTKQEILDSLYAGDEIPGMKIVDVLICKIRKEIEKHTSEEYVETIWGCGYKICNPKARTEEEEDLQVIAI